MTQCKATALLAVVTRVTPDLFDAEQGFDGLDNIAAEGCLDQLRVKP